MRTPLDITGGGTIVGYSSDFIGGERGSCQGVADLDAEAVFFVRGPSSGTMDYRVYSADFVPDIYLRRAPCGSGSENGCDTGSALGGGISYAELRRSVSSGESYYFFVDGGRGSYLALYVPR